MKHEEISTLVNGGEFVSSGSELYQLEEELVALQVPDRAHEPAWEHIRLPLPDPALGASNF